MPNPTVIGSGGFNFPGTGGSGFVNQPTAIAHTQGPSIVSDIPSFQRDYNLRDELIFRVEEGRFSMMRVLFDYARQGGAYVTNDVEPHWLLDYKPHPRFYLKQVNGQGGTAGTVYTTGTFILSDPMDAKRLQAGDFIALMNVNQSPSRDDNTINPTYVESPPGSGIFQLKPLPADPQPEVCEISDVNYTTGAISVKRNQGGEAQTAVRSGIAFNVVANGTGNPGANSIRAEDAFFMKMTKPMAEGRDDVMTWSRSHTWDYNYCQYIVRKWSAIDIQENVYRRGVPMQMYAKNRMEAIEQAIEELEWYAWFGFRKESYDNENRWKGMAGGFFEAVPPSHYIAMQEPDYSSATKDGDFTIKKFNKIFEPFFYYGSQTKVVLCGAGWHTAFSWMINAKTNAVPTIQEGWTVKGKWFEISNGGYIYVVPSDTLSLNGMRNTAVVLDPATFRYGHLQNMDLTIVDPLPQTNIHEKSGEIYGVFTYQRRNFDANWVLMLQPNVQT
jgi:hypothetical protein